MSLVFADIIEILSESISQKQQELYQYHRFWKHITRPYFLLPSKMPEDIQSFFDAAHQEIREDILVVQEALERFAHMESQKLATISEQNAEYFGNTLLSQKRQEALMRGFERIRRQI